MEPKVPAMLSAGLTRPSSTLPWSLLLPRGPHLQDVSQILHPDSNQALGNTEMLVVLSRRAQVRVSCTIRGVAGGPAAWLLQAQADPPLTIGEARPYGPAGKT